MKARMPQGYGRPDVNSLMRQAQKMQEAMTAKQAELDEKEYTTSAGGGVVQVTINGKKEVKALTLKPEVVDPEDVEMLQDLILAAVNEAIRTVEDTNAQEMGKITGGMGLPGM